MKFAEQLEGVTLHLLSEFHSIRAHRGRAMQKPQPPSHSTSGGRRARHGGPIWTKLGLQAEGNMPYVPCKFHAIRAISFRLVNKKALNVLFSYASAKRQRCIYI